MKNFWQNKTVLVTGGAGFVGSHIIPKIVKKGPKKIIIPRFEKYDLREKSVCKEITQGVDIVIHLAAKVGGIGFNMEKPAELFYDNLTLGVNLMHESYRAGVKKFVGLGTICQYPKFTPTPFKEEDLWMGYPEETNAPYGMAKKMLLVQGQAYRKQYGFNAIHLMPVNMYGPGDNFDPQSSHVIPALIKKFITAKKEKKDHALVWGTGKATREFLYVEDCVKAIIMATEKYDKPEPVNIGASFEISIKDLAEMIKRLTSFEGKIIWDSSKPDGQPRRKLDTSRAEKEFGFRATTNFERGLKKTIDWYIKNGE